MSYLRITFMLSVIACLLSACAPPPPPPPFVPTMIYKPVDLGNQRIKLTENYLCQYYQVCQGSVTIQPKIIIIHWTNTATMLDAFNQFQSATNATGQLNSSVHFIVTHHGTVYQMMPSSWMARSVIGLDYAAIDIDNVGTVDATTSQSNLTIQQLKADAYLIHMLKQEYPSIEYLIGHYEYLCFEKTSLWQGFGPGDARPVGDPGPFFMRVLRVHVQDLGLKGAPCSIS